MKAIGLLMLGFLGGLAVAAIGDMVSEEIRARLDRLPHVILRLATRRLPAELRADIGEEWQAELDHVLHDARLYPVWRLAVGIHFAAGLHRAAPRVAHSLALTRPQQAQVHKRSLIAEWVAAIKDWNWVAILAGWILTQLGLVALVYPRYQIDTPILRFLPWLWFALTIVLSLLTNWGGIRWIRSGGDRYEIESSRNIVVSAVVLTILVGIGQLATFFISTAIGWLT